MMTQATLITCIKVNEKEKMTIVARKLLEAAKKIEAQSK